MPDQSSPSFTRKQVLIAAASGFLVGILAGLVGLGGAEERIPFILYGLKAPLYDMIVANLIISFATSGFNFALRVRAGYLTMGAVYISLAMIAGSLIGAYMGAALSHRMSQRRLKAFMAFVLSLVVLRLLSDSLGGGTMPLLIPAYSVYPLAAIFGLLVGIISGSIGVAGGEYRIPVLLYAFSLPIKVAGSASQLISLPTIAVALLKHRRERPFTRRALVLSAVMGAPSLAGVALSSLLLAALNDELIRLVFVLILLYTIARLLVEIVGPRERAT